tara:strand:- start:2064 stop:2333 length:270 start_codon:yes stop_codon:yes gene_type:complete
MEIKLNSWDINQAIEDYLKKKHDLDVDFSEIDDYPCFKYTEREIVYKRHKNGKVKKHKDGYWLVDEKKTKYVEKYGEISDDASISFYLD